MEISTATLIQGQLWLETILECGLFVAELIKIHFWLGIKQTHLFTAGTHIQPVQKHSTVINPA